MPIYTHNYRNDVINYLPVLGVLAADPLRAKSPMSMDFVWRGAVGVADIREEELLCKHTTLLLLVTSLQRERELGATFQTAC